MAVLYRAVLFDVSNHNIIVETNAIAILYFLGLSKITLLLRLYMKVLTQPVVGQFEELNVFVIV